MKINHTIYDNKAINSPFRWAGGKFYARKIINGYIPAHENYVEPFFGGGSIFFYKNKVNSWINDSDDQLINCYKIIQSRVDELIEFLAGEEASKERHFFYKNEFIPKNELEHAARYYYLNRTSYSGIMKTENCYFGYGDKYSMRPENWGRQLLKNHLKLQDIKITCIDFEEVIKESYSQENTFLFIDPPYFNADQQKFYVKSFTHDDHLRLSEILREVSPKINFLLTYDNSEEVKELYSWADNLDPEEWNYTISRTDDQKNKQKLKDGFSRSRGKGKEIFISNYKLQKEVDPINETVA
jgi:DNA adenine methylase